MNSNKNHSDKVKENSDPDTNKGWKIFDAIFSAGLFSLFYESEKARNENNDKKFKQMMYGALFGILFFIILITIATYFFDSSPNNANWQIK